MQAWFVAAPASLLRDRLSSRQPDACACPTRAQDHGPGCCKLVKDFVSPRLANANQLADAALTSIDPAAFGPQQIDDVGRHSLSARARSTASALVFRTCPLARLFNGRGGHRVVSSHGLFMRDRTPLQPAPRQRLDRTPSEHHPAMSSRAPTTVRHRTQSPPSFIVSSCLARGQFIVSSLLNNCRCAYNSAAHPCPWPGRWRHKIQGPTQELRSVSICCQC